MIRKSQFLGLIALTTISTGSAFGDPNELPVSRTAGVVTVNLPAGKTTLMALPLVEIIASGTVSSVSGSVLTLSSAPTSLPDVLAQPHAIKITSRSNQLAGSTNAYGLSAQITAQAGQDVTASLSTAPNVGDEFVIYRLETLGSIFGATNSAGLLGGTSSAAADTVYLSSGGSLVGYFYKTGGLGGTGWKLVSNATGPTQQNAVVSPGTALVVARKAGVGRSITATGDTLPGRETGAVVPGFNVMNNPFTVPTTLAGSGIQSWVTGGTSAAAADLLYLEENGVLTAYWYKSGGLGGTGWRTTTGSADQGSVSIVPGKSIVFQERAGSAGFSLPEPFAE